MEYTELGRTGVTVSKLCLGMMSYGSLDWQKWVLPEKSGRHFVKRALDSGINFFDTANFYSYGESESILGGALVDYASRHDVVICTKVGLPMSSCPNGGGLSRKSVRSHVEESLKRLKTDYIDIYMLHQPDPLTPIEETLDAMHDLVREGKILYTGASNYPAWMLAKAVYSRQPTSSCSMSIAQVQYNLCYREDERDVLPLCIEEGLGVMVYSPLARGWLAGNRGRNGVTLTSSEAVRATTDAKAHNLYGNDTDKRVRDCLDHLAEERGIPPARLAMGWVLGRHGVSSMLCGASEDSHLDEALAALEIRLTDEELARLDGCYAAQPLKDTGLSAVLKTSSARR